MSNLKKKPTVAERVSPTQRQRVVIDKFVVSGSAREEFLRSSRFAMAVVRTLPGFVHGVTFEKSGGPGKYNFVTVVIWESPEALEAARQEVPARYAKSGFDPREMFERLGIEMDRAYYTEMQG